MPWFGEDEWQQLLQQFFARPDELTFGLETGAAALDRFRAAVEQVLSERHEGDVAIATHGTVMSLYVGDAFGEDPYRIWRQLKMPDYRVLAIDGSPAPQGRRRD